MVNKSIVDAVVTMLRMYDVDGETMEHIINEVGMRDQMIKQLTRQNDPVKPEQDPTLTQVVASFTKQELIEYTRIIQERALEAAKEAVKGSCVDIESYVELDLHNKNIEINIDDDSIYNEIISNIEDVFETDDDSVWDEVTNVITSMK